MTSKNKQTLSALDLETRIKVIKSSENGNSQRQLAKQFNVGKTQIQNILAQKECYLKEWKDGVCNGYKRKKPSRNGKVNELVWNWFLSARAKKLPISGPIIQEKAREYAAAAGISTFTASNGWLESFRKRNNIVFRAISGEAGGVEESDVSNWLERVPDIIEGYDLRDIYNMDETGLFFRAIPDKTMIVKGDSTAGCKISKDRITVSFCVSAMGEKEKPLVIHKSLRPRCFKNVEFKSLGVDWHSNPKAWMTSSIFSEWLREFNEKMKKQKRSVLLFLDNAPCHMCLNVKLTNVTLSFLPANTTSKLQPLDQGIIKAFKLQYRCKLMKSLIARMDSAQNATDFAKKISIADAVAWLKLAWEKVEVSTITKCFERCGIKNPTLSTLHQPENSNDDEFVNEIISLGDTIGIQIVQDNLNEEIECYDTLQRDWEDALEM